MQLVARLGEFTAGNIKDLDDKASIARLSEDEPGRWHLGASIIGEECSRKLWFGFHWIQRVSHSGRMHRLFERGHFEEQRFITSLRAIGMAVTDVDGEGKQYRFSTLGEHFGGSCDGFGQWPNVAPFNIEFKTHNEKSFKKLVDKKFVRISKPRHYDQMSLYMEHFGTTQGLYCAVNKNDDERYYEIIKADPRNAADLLKKAEYIITAENPPARIANSPTHHICAMCDFKPTCWENQPPHRNCRSCRFSKPVPQNADWFCTRYEGLIPRMFVKTGCPDWRSHI